MSAQRLSSYTVLADPCSSGSSLCSVCGTNWIFRPIYRFIQINFGVQYQVVSRWPLTAGARRRSRSR